MAPEAQNLSNTPSSADSGPAPTADSTTHCEDTQESPTHKPSQGNILITSRKGKIWFHVAGSGAEVIQGFTLVPESNCRTDLFLESTRCRCPCLEDVRHPLNHRLKLFLCCRFQPDSWTCRAARYRNHTAAAAGPAGGARDPSNTGQTTSKQQQGNITVGTGL